MMSDDTKELKTIEDQANGPESATAFAPCANKKNPPLINATPAPSIINALADASIFLELAALLLPTASCPLEIPNNFPAILLIPAPASPAIALVNAPTNGATLFAILKPLYATKSCGSFDITFAIISSCSNTEDFQARRAQIRYRDEADGKVKLLHTPLS